MAMHDNLTRACYSGPEGTEDVGLCVGGRQRCEGGRYGACAGATLPSEEQCDGADEDCDGQVDEGVCGAP